jgi:hypothetical protein
LQGNAHLTPPEILEIKLEVDFSIDLDFKKKCQFALAVLIRDFDISTPNCGRHLWIHYAAFQPIRSRNNFC